MTTPTTADPTMLDPLAFAAAAAAAAASGGLTFPYFLPSLLSQPSTSTTNAGANSNASTYPFSSLSSSLANPTAGLYPFLSPDWFTSASSMGNLTPGKCRENVRASQCQPTLLETKSSKKRAKSIRTLAEEHEKNASTSNASLLHSALVISRRCWTLTRERTRIVRFRLIQIIAMAYAWAVEVVPMTHLSFNQQMNRNPTTMVNITPARSVQSMPMVVFSLDDSDPNPKRKKNRRSEWSTRTNSIEYWVKITRDRRHRLHSSLI